MILDIHIELREGESAEVRILPGPRPIIEVHARIESRPQAVLDVLDQAVKLGVMDERDAARRRFDAGVLAAVSEQIPTSGALLVSDALQRCLDQAREAMEAGEL